MTGAAEATYPLPVVDLRGTASATDPGFVRDGVRHDTAHVSGGRLVLGRGDDEHEALMGDRGVHA